MHTALYRGNTLFTFGTTALGLLAALAALTDVLHTGTPSAAVSVREFEGLQVRAWAGVVCGGGGAAWPPQVQASAVAGAYNL